MVVYELRIIKLNVNIYFNNYNKVKEIINVIISTKQQQNSNNM